MSGDSDLLKCNSFAMERMKAKDAEDRLERMATKQKAGTPTVRLFQNHIFVKTSLKCNVISKVGVV